MEERALSFSTLQETYRGRLTQQMIHILSIWAQYKLAEQRRKREGILSELHSIFHKIAGAAGIYQFHQISERAKELELLFSEVREGKIEDMALAEEKIKIFSQGVQAILEASFEDNSPLVQIKEKQIILMIEPDDKKRAIFSDTLKRHFKFVDAVKDFNALKTSKIDQALILIVSQSVLDKRTKKILEEYKNNYQLAIVIYSEESNFELRLLAIREGADNYFNLPTDMQVLLDYLENLIAREVTKKYKVLAVDDDTLCGFFYKKLLETHGIEVEFLSEPKKIIDIAMVFKPDLILLDYYLPECNGAELAKLLKQYPALNNIPIIFLSSESSAEIHAEAKLIGAEDFLEKDVSVPHFIRTVMARLKKGAQINDLIERDHLTGFYLRRKLEEMFTILMNEVERYGSNFCYAILDIDFFKDINDHYGHAIGDSVLKKFAKVVKNTLRNGDDVFRYGGDEFCILFQRTSIEMAMKVLDRLKETLSNETFEVDKENIRLAFSAGVTEFHQGESMQHCMENADKALYLAKITGRNTTKSSLDLDN